MEESGQQQRVAIARTLATDPQILLMDEPLSNLDAKLRLEMRTELKRLHSTSEATFVYVTHDQLEAMALSTIVCLMNTAVVQQYAPPLELYGEPNNLFAADFVGNPAMNFMDFVLYKKGTALMMKKEELLLQVCLKKTWQPKKERTEVILGIRPEFVHITSDGRIPAKVISSFPYGMETTVVVSCMGTTLRLVEFGSVNFKEGEDVMLSIDSDKSCIFYKDTGKLLSIAAIQVV